MTSLPPENAPQLGTCPKCGGKHKFAAHDDALAQSTAACWHSWHWIKPVAAPERCAYPNCGFPESDLIHDPTIAGPVPYHAFDRSVAAPENQPRPDVEVYRKFLMDLYSDKCSMEQIASAAYILAGEARGEVPQCVHCDRTEEEHRIAHQKCEVYHGFTPADRIPPYLQAQAGASPSPDEAAGDFLANHPDCVNWQNVCHPGIGGIRFTWPQVVKLLEEWRARAPQPVSSGKGTDDEKFNTTGVIDDIGSNDAHADNSNQPLAPSKLSAQEFYPKWAQVVFGYHAGRVLPDAYLLQFTEDYAREYASSSNAAFSKELMKKRIIDTCWSIWRTEDGILQVVPNFGREHELTAACWCQPHWDTKTKGLLIHECDN